MSQNESQRLYLREELTINPIRGYREWMFNVGYMISAWDKTIWPWDEPAEAKCRKCRVVPSDAPCNVGGLGCGFYAWHRPESVYPSILGKLRRAYYGVVETEGNCRVVWHKRGFRADKLRIVAIADTGRNARMAAANYAVPCIHPHFIADEFPPQVSWTVEMIG
jgi:hypothetical protein